jgi:RNA polymerase sigma-70 factor (ECF subfamily)
MHSTSPSLLERLRQPDAGANWNRFVALYTPLIYSWACRIGLQDQDAADLVQDVFVLLLQKMPQFHYDPQRRFRSWLRTLVVNRWHDSCRRRAAALRHGNAEGLDELAVSDPAEQVWEEEYSRHVIRRALELMQAEFEPTTWKACWEMSAAGRPAAEVAAELGITLAAAYAAKSRVLRRLRQELDGLLD